MAETEAGVQQAMPYDWTTTDAVVSDARARGLNVYTMLAYTPGWANGGQLINVPPTNAGDWYRFVYPTVSRYRGSVQHWVMWNEPNLEGFFAGTLEQYIDGILRVDLSPKPAYEAYQRHIASQVPGVAMQSFPVRCARALLRLIAAFLPLALIDHVIYPGSPRVGGFFLSQFPPHGPPLALPNDVLTAEVPSL
jgi:hypothetical protein